MSRVEHKEPVDAVITWVDGHDPKHQQKLAAHLATLGISRPVAAAPTRFNQCGEIDYCISSILHHAPWVRTIYVVTDEQTPPGFQQLQNSLPAGKLQLVDHRDIFTGFEQCLPTFNSLSIESMLWRIPGLAEQFIYLNDDCSFIQPVNYEDFFRDDKLVLRGYWRKQAHWYWRSRIKKILPMLARLSCLASKSDDFRQFQENSAILAGWQTHYFHLPHAPLPFKKSLIAQFSRDNPDALANNARYALRSTQQFYLVSVVYHLALRQQQAIIDNRLLAVSINPACHSEKKIQKRLHSTQKNNKIAFMCLQSLDAAAPAMQDSLLAWLDKRTARNPHGLY